MYTTYKYTSTFKKQYKKLPRKLQDQTDDRILIFKEDPSNEMLRNHPLKGVYAGLWSINVSGDLRVLYKKAGEEIVIFAFVGTHSQLYK